MSWFNKVKKEQAKDETKKQEEFIEKVVQLEKEYGLKIVPRISLIPLEEEPHGKRTENFG